MGRVAMLMLLVTAVAMPAPVLAVAPMLFSYQGQLTDAGGSPITAPTTVRFTILWGGTATENPSTGKPVYQENVVLTPDAGGVFHHLIGAGAPTSQCDEDRNGTAAEPCVLAPNDFPSTGTTVFLDLVIDPAGAANLLAPRQQLVNTPYAMNAASIEGITPANLVTSVTAGSGLSGGGTGGTVALAIAPGGVTVTMIGTGSVGAAAILDSSVGAAEIATDAVGSAEIAIDAVGNAEIAANAVGTFEIIDASITQADIATSGVGSAEIADGSIVDADIAGATITSSKLSLVPVISPALTTTSTTEATSNLGPKTFCALAEVMARAITNSGTNTWCRVFQSGSDWMLGARTNGVGTEVTCQAVCF